MVPEREKERETERDRESQREHLLSYSPYGMSLMVANSISKVSRERVFSKKYTE